MPALDFVARPAGSGSLEVEVVAGMSAVTGCGSASPLRILTPRERGGSVWAYLSSFGGGLVAGDDIAVTVRVGEGARCYLGTQASTKVFKGPKQSRQQLRAEVKSGALLVLAPDPVQAFASANYRQSQEFRLANDASLVVVDWFSSGRVARGERWAFNRYESRNEIFVGDRRVALDALVLDEADGPLAAPQRMGRMNCLATVYMLGPLVNGPAQALLAQFGQEPLEKRAQLAFAASPLASGMLLRIAGESLEAVGAQVSRALEFCDRFLGDHPWRGKW